MSLQATTHASPAVLLADRRLLLTLLLEASLHLHSQQGICTGREAAANSRCAPLQAQAEKGRAVLLPVGCNGFDDWLLDAITVERLARQIKVGGNLDLIHACTGSTSLAMHSPSPGGLDLPPVVDFKDLSNRPRLVVEDPRVPALRLKSLGQMGAPFPGRPPDSGAQSRLRWGAATDPEARVLRCPPARPCVLPQPPAHPPSSFPTTPTPKHAHRCAALDEVQLKELAYTIFVGCCAASASPNVMHGIRAQMEVMHGLPAAWMLLARLLLAVWLPSC
jgi:hypothetical protein